MKTEKLPGGFIRLKHSALQIVRETLRKKQDNTCPLCECKFKGTKKPAQDHDHKTGIIRDVLCLNCNRREGEIINRAQNAAGSGKSATEWLQRLVEYYARHEKRPHGNVLYPSHKTEAEKRLARNKKARERYQKNKGK